MFSNLVMQAPQMPFLLKIQIRMALRKYWSVAREKGWNLPPSFALIPNLSPYRRRSAWRRESQRRCRRRSRTCSSRFGQKDRKKRTCKNSKFVDAPKKKSLRHPSFELELFNTITGPGLVWNSPLQLLIRLLWEWLCFPVFHRVHGQSSD